MDLAYADYTILAWEWTRHDHLRASPWTWRTDSVLGYVYRDWPTAIVAGCFTASKVRREGERCGHGTVNGTGNVKT